MSNLRSNLIRLAHQKPELRAAILPLVKQAGLQKPAILALAKKLLANDKLAKIVVSALTSPSAWKFTKKWDEETWKGALLNNSKNYEGLAQDDE